MNDLLNDWYYMDTNFRGHGFARGPFTLNEMRTRFEQGVISNKTQVRCGRASFWHPLEDVLALLSPKAVQQPRVVFPGFWRKLVLALFVLVACTIGLRLGLSTKTATGVNQRYNVSQEPLTREAVIRLTNETRSHSGLHRLTENQLLNAVAEERAKDMLEKQYFGHVSPTGEQASDVAQRTGYRYKLIAENIASGLFFSNQKLIDGWMQSPGHRKNMLSSSVQEIGVSVVKGVLRGEETWVGVQIFGLQSPLVAEKSCIMPPSELAGQITARKIEVQNLNERVTSLKEELERENTSIELERIAAGRDYRRVADLNIRISDYNAKTNWCNQMAAELRGKTTSLNLMVEEYNRKLQEYRDCQNS